MNIAILDDHELIRFGVSGVLRALDVNITISVSTAEELFAALQRGTPCDILLLDILLPGTNGIEVAKRMRAAYPDIKIIVLSVDTHEYTIMQLMHIGIDGFVSKTAPLDEVAHAVQSLSEGVPFYGHDIAVMLRDITDAKTGKRTTSLLTKRELEIVEACCDGKLGKEIAEEFHISLRAVNSHKTNIFKKLGLSSSVEMVRYALEHGII